MKVDLFLSFQTKTVRNNALTIHYDTLNCRFCIVLV